MVSKKSTIIIVGVVVIVIILASVMVYGFVVNQPHFGFPSKNQVNSQTHQNFKNTSTSKANISSNSTFNFTGIVQSEYMTYSSGTNGSYISVLEFHFSSSFKAAKSYSDVLITIGAIAFFGKIAVNSTHGAFLYSGFSVLGTTILFAHSGSYAVFLLAYGVASSGAQAAFNTTLSSMTSFNI